MIKPLKLKKTERLLLIKELLDYWIDYAGEEEARREVEQIYTYGFDKLFVPYIKRTDKKLIQDAFSTFDCTNYDDILDLFILVMDTKKRAEKISFQYNEIYNGR